MNDLEQMTGIMVVGLTGQTGAGKSTVSKIFEENGFAVINADIVARQVVEKGCPCLDELTDFFGEGILNETGELNRRVLGDIVFNDQKKLEILNSITYPYITAEIFERIKKYKDEGEKFILLDAPTLFESRADDFCDLIISVIAHEEIREKRIMERDGLTHEQAKSRMNSQHTEEFFKKNSDYYIKNNKSIDNVYSVAKEVVDKIKGYYNKIS